MQVAAVHRQIGRAVTRLDRGAERMVVGDRAGDAVAAERGRRPVRDLPHAVLDAEPAVDLHGVRALLQAGADAGEPVGLLEDLRFEAALVQGGRDRQSADAGSDDRDAHGTLLEYAGRSCREIMARLDRAAPARNRGAPARRLPALLDQ